jgi:hypothetical protein
MKLPKQIKRWCYKARLRPESGSSGAREKIMYYKGRGRRWRIGRNYLDMSCVESDFDRWANSTEFRFPLPSCEKDFVSIVRKQMTLSPQGNEDGQRTD